MATQLSYFLDVSFLCSNVNPKSKKAVVATFRTRLKPAAAKSYLDAADDAARAATGVGDLIHRTNQMSLGTQYKWGINFEIFEDTAVPPVTGTNAYSFDKYAAALLGAGENSQITIPARDMSVATLESDGVTVAVGSVVPDAWRTAYELVALNEDLNPVTVQRLFVVR
jgi:hypothetical protein